MGDARARGLGFHIPMRVWGTFFCLYLGNRMILAAISPGSAESWNWLRLCGSLSIIGAAFWIWMYSDRVLREDISSRAERLNVPPKEAGFVELQRGPWKVSRNPIYLAFVLIFVGLYVLDFYIGWLISAGLIWTIMHFWVVLPDERRMHEKFGATWDTYFKRTRRWL